MDLLVSAQVLVASGHMVDTPDRPQPRFPPDQVPRVTAEIREVLAGWEVGAQTTVFSSAARGADIIVCEEALARGATVRIRLAKDEDEFERESVALPGSDWSERFHSLLAAVAEVEVLGTREGDVFERTNEWLLDSARAASGSEPPHAIVIWDGQEGDGAGGTRDFLHGLGFAGPNDRVAVIDPTRRAYEPRQRTRGPKKLLAIDGGGIRGVLSLEILAALETRLRTHYGNGGYVLSDFFDYIAGTSTGAIIAAALARGKSVTEIREKYETLGRAIFKKRFLLMRGRAIYRDKPLTAELEDFFGRHTTLGDPEMRSLLLVVLHNTVTDSPWPLSNCTKATYNRVERNLKDPPDRNLDLSLTTLVRGSTAAPLFFPPQLVRVGGHDYIFQDGGITPFNNPALILFLMATLPEYHLEWPVGEQNLLLVSVGSGSAAAVHPGLLARSVGLRFQVKNLPSVFMNGASTTQDLVCRSLGRTRYGDPIDVELDSRVDISGVGGQSLFSYLRYNANLSAKALTNAGITDLTRTEGPAQTRCRRFDAATPGIGPACRSEDRARNALRRVSVGTGSHTQPRCHVTRRSPVLALTWPSASPATLHTTSSSRSGTRSRNTTAPVLVHGIPWHFLNFLPEPQGHGSLRPTL